MEYKAENTSSKAKGSPNSSTGTFFQPKLRIGPAHDQFEQEADNIAEQVVSPESSSGLFFKPVASVHNRVQRMCAACAKEEEEKGKIQRKEAGNKDERPETSPIVSEALKAGGKPMDSNSRNFMESRFGYDFSHVKIHTDEVAAKSAESVNALAYTSGNDIVFNKGLYSPGTESGKRLLAHELTHTIQQNSSDSVIQRESIREEVPTITSRAGNIVSGYVDRYEFDNQKDYNNRLKNNRASAIYHGKVNVRFNKTTCTLELPVKIQIVNQHAGLNTFCGDINGQHNDPIRPVSRDVLNEARQNIPELMRKKLNNWYSVQLGNPKAAGCKTPDIPIKVVVSVATSNPDFTIILTANKGRSYVTGDQTQMALCDGDISDNSTIVHEMGHAVLANNDEYHEDEASRPVSRERLGQYSRMAQDSSSRLQEFYARHFQFAAAFMNSAFPGCNATLNRVHRSVVEFIPYYSLGTFQGNNGSAFYLSLGLELGIPLVEMRRLNLILGTNSTLMSGFEGNYTNVFALLTGFRVGLNYRNSFGNSSVLYGLTGFGEAGAAYNFTPDENRVLPPQQLSGYAEGGLSLNLTVANQIRLGVEGATGVLDLGRKNNPYYRLGFNFGVSF